MMFIRYPVHSKGYVMYGEPPHSGMTIVDSHNVGFLEDEFSRIDEIKQDIALYELPLDDQLLLSEGEDLNTHSVIEDSTIPLSGRDDELLVAQENQPENKVRPPSPVHEHEHEHEVSPLVQDNDNDSFSTEESIPLGDRGRNTSEVQNSTEPMLQRVSVKEYLDDIFKSKRRYSYALL